MACRSHSSWAAARVKVLRPEQILERLGHSLDLLTAGSRDAPERQRTLRATIAWSHELLTEPEARAFAAVATFPGSFDLVAAEAIGDVDVDLVSSLVDKSLLRQTAEGRFFMLETIHEYASEQLRQLPDEREVRERHALHFLQLAEAQPEPRGPVAAAVLERPASEHDNLLAALTWFLETGRLELEQRLAVALSVFWDVRGYLSEGQRWLEVEWESETPLRAKALARAAGLAAMRGRQDEASALTEASAALYEKLGDPAGTFHVLTNGGLNALRRGEWDRSKSLLAEAYDVGRTLDEQSTLIAECNFGYATLTWGDYERAVEVLEGARERAERLGDLMGLLTCAQNLGLAMLALGRLDRAVLPFREGCERARGLGFDTEAAYCLEGLAAVQAAAGRRLVSARLLAAADRVHQELGARREHAEQELYDRTRRELEQHEGSELAAAEADGAA
jgi:tetratricopeptide (TPR) repeat protein